jgi:murein DD-endopeptidase MepM/ murein hydrolase activator NlpD
MRFMLSARYSRSRYLLACRRLSFLAVAGLLASGCSMVQLREPVFTGSTPNQQAILSGDAATSPYGGPGAPTAAMQSSDLPPPAGASVAPAYAAAPPQPYTPAGAADAMPVPLGQMAAAPAAPPPLGAPPTTLGAQAATIAAPPAASGARHTVQPGDTMWNVSQRYGVPVDALIAANGGSTTIKIGQALTIPGGAAPAEVQVATAPAMVPEAPSAAPADAQTAALPPAAPAAPVEIQQASLPSQGAAEAAAPAPAVAPAADTATDFRWPVRGRIISGFGKKADGERNDGINLAVPGGTEVKAAEDGTVIYAGNELKSYGNLVLVRHADGWVSAYAHNSDLKVKRGDTISRGQVIALSGMTGGVTTPQVHFELRKDAAPVDPLQHLSES